MDKKVTVSVGFGIRKGPLGGAEHLRIAHLWADTRQAASSGVGRPLAGEALELFLERLHLFTNGFDREEHCQPPDGRVRRGIKEEVRDSENWWKEGRRTEGRKRGEEDSGRGKRWKQREEELLFVSLGHSRHIGIWCFRGQHGVAGGQSGLSLIRTRMFLESRRS